MFCVAPGGYPNLAPDRLFRQAFRGPAMSGRGLASLAPHSAASRAEQNGAADIDQGCDAIAIPELGTLGRAPGSIEEVEVLGSYGSRSKDRVATHLGERCVIKTGANAVGQPKP